MRLRDKVAIVTGGGSGLGKAIALRFASEGAIVIIVDVNEAAMASTTEEIQGLGGKARAYKVDVTQQQDLRNFMEDVVAAEGRVDILINNAGITRYRAFGSMGDADWSAVLDLDLKGVFFCAQAAAPYMERQQYGKIVNISSSLGTGTTPHIGGLTPGASAPYASAKAAVIQLTKTLARELGPSGVNVNCVAPGFFLTPLTGATRSPDEVAEHIRVRTSMAVLNRPGRLEELAATVLFFATDDSSFVTGHTLYVDGGRTDRM
ncbi:SDR family NAD(P)-dependent oxidoreductase [Cupriavidus necator]|uniref:SDR family NAD(P)-dependent oxidoreductase n=1 Tax=Cupriavidus necator TaxID=106590 RepID=UPI0002DE84D4|nr:glucose 1-dehydrogenase [Cupriavidus necator]MDX6008313.1 glucose 1-dehydrogenase [Cupriavidus necator]